MKKWFSKFLVTMTTVLALIAAPVTCVHASSTAENPHFDFACGSQFTMHAGESKEITWFCDRDYSVYTTQNTSSKTAIGSSGRAGNNTGIINIDPNEKSNRVVFYFYPDGDSDNYDTLIVDIAPSNLNTAAVSQTPAFTGTAIAENGTHTLIYDAMGQPRAAFAIGGSHGFEKVSLGAFVATANGIYLTVNTPYDTKASVVSISETDKAAARMLGINGIILNNKTVNWP